MAMSPLLKIGLAAFGAYGVYRLVSGPKKEAVSAATGEAYEGDGTATDAQVAAGQVAVSAKAPYSQVRAYVLSGGTDAEYQLIYSNPPLRALYEWLKETSGTVLKFSQRPDIEFSAAPAPFVELREQGLAWAADPLLVLGTKLADQDYYKEEMAINAMRTGRILATEVPPTESVPAHSAWWVYKAGIAIEVPLFSFGLLAAPGDVASRVIAFVGMAAEAEAGEPGFVESALETGTEYLGELATEGIELAGSEIMSEIELPSL